MSDYNTLREAALDLVGFIIDATDDGRIEIAGAKAHLLQWQQRFEVLKNLVGVKAEWRLEMETGEVVLRSSDAPPTSSKH